MPPQDTLDRTRFLCQELRKRNIVLTDDRDDWLHVMFALRELGNDGLELFKQLSAMSAKYDARECERQWAKMHSQGQGHSCSLSTLYHMASQHGVDLKDLARDYYQLHPDSQQTHAEWLAQMQQQAQLEAQRRQQAEEDARQRRLHPDVIDSLWVTRTCSTSSTLMSSLVERGILTSDQMLHAVQLYRIGALRDGGTIFWYIDEHQRARDGKLMWYGPDCHRLKPNGQGVVGWMGARMRSGRAPYCHPDTGHPLLPRAWRQQLCLFGQHLLAFFPDRPVAIVESEKTALICNELLAERGYIWLATGGRQQLRPECFEPLFGRAVSLFPDTDSTGETFRHWQQIAQQGQRYTHRVIRVLDELERAASPDQKARKIDIADLLTEPAINRFHLDQMISTYPAVTALIDAFGLRVC